MRVYNSFASNNKKQFFGLHFKAKPHLAPEISIRNYHDALKSWEFLKSAKFLDVHDDAINYANKEIRKRNYSFLDKLTSYSDKYYFIEKFCEFTYFPYLRQMSDNIHKTFIDCVNKISNNLNSNCYDNRYEVLDAGYDPTCSLGLKKAFTGSDLDKGYIIIKGNSSEYYNDIAINNFKGELWDNLDQRIVSLNHPNTAIDVYTEKQILDKIQEFDDIINKDRNKPISDLQIMGTILAFPILLPLLLIESKYQDAHNTDPYVAGKFNRSFAKLLNTSKQREDAKNFAFFIETVRENLKLTKDFFKTDNLFEKIKKSIFVSNSNVTQIPAWQEKISGGYLKNKLINRERLERDFYLMSVEEKYELVKDIIKHSSNDQSYKFSQYFINDDDIAGRYDRLLKALK